MNKPVQILYENGVRFAHADRVIVAYYELENTLKVVRVADGEVLREEPFEWDEAEFLNKIETYDIMCNHK